MLDEIIPNDIKQFFLKYIDSVAEWEALLLLRAHAQEEWDAVKVAKNLYTNEVEANALLVQLMGKGFVISPSANRYRYQAQVPSLEEKISQAADLYRRYLIAVTNFIHSKTKNRIQAFADAFRMRKDD